MTKANYPGSAAAFDGYTYTGSGAVTTVDIIGHTGFSSALDGINVDGQGLLSDGMDVTKLSFGAATDLTVFKEGDAISEIGNGDDGIGSIREISGQSLILGTKQPNWDVGSYVLGPPFDSGLLLATNPEDVERFNAIKAAMEAFLSLIHI